MSTRPKCGVNVEQAARDDDKVDSFADCHGGSGFGDSALDRAVEAYWRKRYAHVRRPGRVLILVADSPGDDLEACIARHPAGKRRSA